MSSSNNITLHVEGMTCANCSLGIKKQLEKQGMENVSVNFATGEASYTNTGNLSLDQIKNSINTLGYKVIDRLRNHCRSQTAGQCRRCRP